MKPCAVIVWDRVETRRQGRMVTRPCGAPTKSVITVAADPLFAVCHRHTGRLRRAFPSLATNR